MLPSIRRLCVNAFACKSVNVQKFAYKVFVYKKCLSTKVLVYKALVCKGACEGVRICTVSLSSLFLVAR